MGSQGKTRGLGFGRGARGLTALWEVCVYASVPLGKHSPLSSCGEVGIGARKMRLEKTVRPSAPSRQGVLRGAR